MWSIKNRMLQTQLDNLEVQLKAAQAQNSKYQAQIITLEDTIEQLKKQLEATKSELEKAENTVKAKQCTIEDLEKKVAGLQGTLLFVVTLCLSLSYFKDFVTSTAGTERQHPCLLQSPSASQRRRTV